uniref:Uncharacterized protein n=1 Tax=Glossina pallidipes TaxID=7398 RepID=A0A1A9ZAL0_GLOPL
MSALRCSCSLLWCIVKFVIVIVVAVVVTDRHRHRQSVWCKVPDTMCTVFERLQQANLSLYPPLRRRSLNIELLVFLHPPNLLQSDAASQFVLSWHEALVSNT